MNKIIGFTAASLLVAACNIPKPGDDYYIYISPQYTTEQQADVILRLGEWQDAANTQVKFPLSLHVVIEEKTCQEHDQCSFMIEACDTSCRNAITIHPATQSFIDANPGTNGDTIGLCQFHAHNGLDGGYWWSNIYVSSELDPSDWRRTLLHEVGHSLGLVHTAEQTIMCKDLECAAVDITSADIQQYMDLRH